MTARAQHFRIRWLAALAAAFVLLAFVSLAPAALAQDPIPNPSANRTPSQSTLQACFSQPASQACADDALADVNAARISEGDLPMVLPGDWSALTIPQQLLALSNLERVDRGLNPIEGLSAPLDNDAQTGASDDQDPTPTNVYGSTWTANWEGGYVSPLLSDFAWMYDDGYGSENLDCTTSTSENCWGHRRDILWDFSEPAVMGAAYDPASSHGASETELFVGGDSQTGPGQADEPIAPTWATIAATLPVGLSATSLSLTSGATTTSLEAWASGEVMHVSAAVTTGSTKWRVSPASCQLNPGQTCNLTLTATSTTPGDGTLTITGPNGNQTVALNGPSPKPVTPQISAKLNHSKIKRGRSAKFSGTVSTYAPGTYAELQQRQGKSWRSLAHVELRLGGKFSFTIKGRSKGKYSYRVSVAANGYFRSAASKSVTLKVS
jgi:hypothetical protein